MRERCICMQSRTHTSHTPTHTSYTWRGGDRKKENETDRGREREGERKKENETDRGREREGE